MQSAAKAGVATPLLWDTEFWGFRIGRVEGPTLDDDRLREVDEWARREGMKCLFFLADASDVASAHMAEAGGFRLMDVRVELRRTATGDDELRPLREARAQDDEEIREIARGSFRVTRFYADPGFADARCDELYESWTRNSLEGLADGVLVAEHEGRPAGYVTCQLDESRSMGSIGLIAVSNAFQRAGLGSALTRGAVAWCRDRGMREMAVVTQGRNRPALRTFQQAGFMVDALGLWFHKWYSD